MRQDSLQLNGCWRSPYLELGFGILWEFRMLFDLTG